MAAIKNYVMVLKIVRERARASGLAATLHSWRARLSTEMKITVGHRPFSVLFSLMTNQLPPCLAIMAYHKRHLLPVWIDVLDNFCLLTRMSDDLFHVQSNNYGADDQYLNDRPNFDIPGHLSLH